MRFLKRKKHAEYKVVIDIESGAVGIAIVASVKPAAPQTVWSVREVMPLREKVTAREAGEDLRSVLEEAVRACGTSGLRTLAHHDPSARIENIAVSITAPWSQTITKTVTIDRDRTFVITEEVLKEAIRNAEAETNEAFEREAHAKAHFSVLESTMIALSANGYAIKDPIGVRTKTFTVTIAVQIADSALLKTIEDSVGRTFPRAAVRTETFMHFLYASEKAARDPAHACLIDVTGDATEAGLIRDHVLTEVSHTPYGIHSLARSIADLLNVPPGEALAYMRSESMHANKPAAIDDVTALYRTNLEELFARLGGKLALPRTILLHTDTGADAFLSAQIAQAAHAFTGQTHRVEVVARSYLGL